MIPLLKDTEKSLNRCSSPASPTDFKRICHKHHFCHSTTLLPHCGAELCLGINLQKQQLRILCVLIVFWTRFMVAIFSDVLNENSIYFTASCDGFPHLKCIENYILMFGILCICSRVSFILTPRILWCICSTKFLKLQVIK